MTQHELLENSFLEETQDEPSNEPPVEIRPESSRDEPIYDQEVARSEDWEDCLGESVSIPQQVQPKGYKLPEEMSSLEVRYTSSPTLGSHLMWQLRLPPLSDDQEELGETIIGDLSSSGHFQASPERMVEIARADSTGKTSAAETKDRVWLTVEEVGTVLKAIQLLGPVGVTVRILQECLLIQIGALGYGKDQILVGLARSHLGGLEAHRYKPLLRKLRLNMDELGEYLDAIRSLDPMPGVSFGEGMSTLVSPDIFVYKMDREFLIAPNEDGPPDLHLSPVRDNVSESVLSEEKEYFSEKIRSTARFIKSLYRRQRTLYKIVESIVKHQRGFLEEGINKLRPLTLKDTVDDVNTHESTVSHIMTNRYVATPFGMYELRFFFNSALELDNGSQVGSGNVKVLVKKCISEEDPRDPLSDGHIDEILKEHSKMNIARRMVAKHRMAMDTPSSPGRRAHS